MTYAFDNQSMFALAHHEALSSLLDPFTRQRILGLIDVKGRRCLEVGAGAGSIASWLASQVGARGQVVATDIKPGLMSPHGRLDIINHDVTEGPVPAEDFNLIHARLVLNHLPKRREAVHNMAQALARGGVLLTQDFRPPAPFDFVIEAPTQADTEVLRKFHSAHMMVLDSHENDRDWSLEAPRCFEAQGLVMINTLIHGAYWRGANPGCKLLAAGLGHLYHELVRAGITEHELHRVGQLLMNPAVTLHGYYLYSTSGWKPR